MLVEQTVAEILDVSSIQFRVSSQGATVRFADDERGAVSQERWRRVTDDNPEGSTAVTP